MSESSPSSLNENKKPLLLLDWDGTFRAGVSVIDFLAFLSEKYPGNKNFPYFKEHIQGSLQNYRNNPIDNPYKQLVVDASKSYGHALKDVKVSQILENVREFVEIDKAVFPFFPDFLDQLRDGDYETHVITGSPTHLVSAYFEGIPDVYVHGLSVCEIESEKLQARIYNGEAVPPFYGLREFKEQKALEITRNGQCPALLGMGDTEADFPLLLNSQYPFLMHGKGGHSTTAPDALKADENLKGRARVVSPDNFMANFFYFAVMGLDGTVPSKPSVSLQKRREGSSAPHCKA